MTDAALASFARATPALLAERDLLGRIDLKYVLAVLPIGAWRGCRLPPRPA